MRDENSPAGMATQCAVPVGLLLSMESYCVTAKPRYCEASSLRKALHEPEALS